jgi:hypothetical protein
MQNSAVGNFSPNKTEGTKQKRLNSKVLVSWPCVFTDAGRVKKEMSDLLVLIVRKHVYNCNRLIKAADHIHVGVRTCTALPGESTEAVRHEL